MPHILFCTLRTFSKTGGIEKVCRILSKALHDVSGNVQMVSMYDKTSDAKNNRYFPEQHFKGFQKNKLQFVLSTLAKGRKYDVVILSHINLLTVGWVIKITNPSTKLILLTHGIEVWDRLSSMKRVMLKLCDQIWSVSEYTRAKLVEVNQVRPAKVKVFNNCLDPYLQTQTTQTVDIRKLFGIPGNAKIVLTLTRLSATERRKGYLNVMSALAELMKSDPTIYYLIAGGYDESEKQVILKHAQDLNIQQHIVLTGYIDDAIIPALFQQADLYVMPSKKEGFGIVFIEALFFGLPVIGGNADGTTDALKNGEFGMLVDPDDVVALKDAIRNALNKGKIQAGANVIMEQWGFEQYKNRLKYLIHTVENNEKNN